MPQTEDELLAIRCQLGERDALHELVERYADRLRGFLQRVARNEADADDLVQDVWLRVLRGLPGLRDPRRFRSWLFGIAHRALIDRLRARYASLELEGDDEPADPSDLQQEQIDRDEVERGLAVLAPVDREAVVLFYLESLPLAELAESTAVPIGTVKSRLHRARRQMRKALDGETRASEHHEGDSA